MGGRQKEVQALPGKPIIYESFHDYRNINGHCGRLAAWRIQACRLSGIQPRKQGAEIGEIGKFN